MEIRSNTNQSYLHHLLVESKPQELYRMQFLLEVSGMDGILS